MKTVGITYHPKYEIARAIAEDARKRLAGRADVWTASAWDEDARERNVPGTDLIICCGGDGTVLRAARAVIPHPITILGVNVGRIGFLTEVTPPQLFEQLDAIVDGAGRVETRAMMEVATVREGAAAHEAVALNDVVVGRAQIGRTVQFAIRSDDTTLGSYRADGVIVATATGSTAYSLSVGGPILHPESREIIVTPVAPHLAPNNSLVLPADSRVEIEVAAGQHGLVSIDGQADVELGGGDCVRVRTSDHAARFLRLGPPGDFLQRVGRRLNWLSE